MENQHNEHHPKTEVRKTEGLKVRKTESQNPSNAAQRDAMNTPNESYPSNPASGVETMQTQHHSPEHLQNQKPNKDQVTNKDSDPSVVRDPKKQDNTVTTAPDHKDKTLTSKAETTMSDTNKQQNHNVDGSVIVEDEDEASVISDDVEK